MPLKDKLPNLGVVKLELLPGTATPNQEDALQPFLGPDEKAIAAAVNANADALSTVLPGGAPGVALSQKNWFVDSVTGNDTNDGKTAGTALQTVTEITRRWGATPLLQPPVFPVKIKVRSATLLPTDEPYFDGVRALGVAAAGDPNLTLEGTVFPGANLGVVTAVTAINHAVADGALLVTIGAIVWPAARTRLRILGGARDGAVAYVVTANVGAGQSRTSAFCIVTPDKVPDMTFTAPPEVPPQSADGLIVAPVTRP